ncbi:MAG: hypothetical protein ACLRXQ_03075 [Phascolarctobacterium faecium]
MFTTDAVFLAASTFGRQARVLNWRRYRGHQPAAGARGAAQVVGVDCNPHVVEPMRARCG